MRAAPGAQLSAGRLRVDAARAITKLREYQLADRTAWILEAIRAAVASGATRISLRGDSNDVWLRWQGAPWDAADLPRLFDELVSPEAVGERQQVRLLAAAVNSALGLSPAYVDVFAIDGKNRALRARYTPDVLVPPSGELGESPLHRVMVESSAPPPGAGEGMAVHLRRRIGLEVLSYLLRDEPPELTQARRACRDLSVLLQVGEGRAERELGRHRGERDVLRLPLGNDLDGFLAVIDPVLGQPPMVALAERGVVLVEGALSLGDAELYGALPIRMLLDAPRLPTNASRSQVRRDGHPIPAAMRRAGELLPVLIEQLVGRLDGSGTGSKSASGSESASGAVSAVDLARARAAALAIIAAGERWSWSLPPPLRALGELPLVRDACGAPRPATRTWRPFAYTGRAPLPAELSPWLSDVLWIPPGDASACLVSPEAFDPRAARQHVRWARREHRARRRFFAHARRDARAEPTGEPRIRARLEARVADSCVADGWLTGMTGEVCILAEGERGQLVLLHEGRELERLDFESRLPFAAAIDAPGLLPADRYRAATRDAAFARAERAMRGAVVRAMEALALAEAGSPVPAGFTLGPSADPEAHARSLRAAAALVGELGVVVTGPLWGARAWRSVTGEWLSLAELRQLPGRAFGTVPPGAVLELPAGRVVIEADEPEHALLDALRGEQLVIRYDPHRSRASRSSAELAEYLLLTGHPFALELPGERVAAAIAPAHQARLLVHHHGLLLTDRVYAPSLGAFWIAFDADAAIPDWQWRIAVHEGVGADELRAWEVELMRATARALVGMRPLGLHGAGAVELDGELGRALCLALEQVEPAALLGAELLAELRAAPLFQRFGSPARWSAAALAEPFAATVSYVEDAPAAGDEQVAAGGFAPLRGGPRLAGALARLVGAPGILDGAEELARRRVLAARALRLAAHRATPPSPGLAANPACVELACALGRGRVTVAREDALTMQILVESRPFQYVRYPDELPLGAAVDCGETLADEGFVVIPAPTLELLRDEVKLLAPSLLLAIARQRPEALAEPGAPRRLLARSLAEKLVPLEVREELATLTSFPELRGGRVILAGAPQQLAFAAWQGEWIEASTPAAVAAPSEGLDGPIVYVPEGDVELRGILAALHRGWIDDVNDAVVRSQAQRRMELGLVARPAVPGVNSRWKRKLEELGEAGRALGPGEIALVDEASSSLLLHVHGELRERARLPGVMPAVHLAIEAPDLVTALAAQPRQMVPKLFLDVLPGDRRELVPAAQHLALELVRQVVSAAAAAAAPPPRWLLRRLRRLVLLGQLAAELSELLLFETVAGAWISWRAVAEQIAIFGNVWVVAERGGGGPLDPRRLVLLLPTEEQQLARSNGHAIINAERELRLDAEARANQARPAATSLSLDPEMAGLGHVVLDGDGVTAPRGVVAVLASHDAGRRGLHLHRQMLRFEPIPDGCAWPTLAFLDDARLQPNRTWSRPAVGAVFTELRATVHDLSEHILASLVRPPDDAPAALRITRDSHDGLPSLRGSKAQLRGALWIAGPPGAPGDGRALSIIDGATPRSFTPAPDLGLDGTLLVYFGNDDVMPPASSRVLGELCNSAHAQLTRQLATRPDADPDLVAAHVALGLALGHLAPHDAGALRFPCFLPHPIGAEQLSALLGAGRRLPIAGPGDDSATLAIIDDGSALACLLVPRLGVPPRRAYSWLTRLVPPPSSGRGERAEQAELGERAEHPTPPAAPPRPSHPLDPLVAQLHQRLAALGLPPARFALVEGVTSPMVRFGAMLELAADHPQLIAIAAAIAAGTAWRHAALDALTAHVVSVLNIALTSVTDATEAHALGLLLQEQAAATYM